MPEFTRFGRRPTGDIRNFPRKDALETTLLNFSTDKFEPEIILKVGNAIDVIHKIYITGSWGRGTAIPFVSDLDIIYIVDNVPVDKVSIPTVIETKFIAFSHVEIFYVTDEEGPGGIKFLLGGNLDDGTGLGYLTYDDPKIAYNLTDRQDIFIENDEIKGLGL